MVKYVKSNKSHFMDKASYKSTINFKISLPQKVIALAVSLTYRTCPSQAFSTFLIDFIGQSYSQLVEMSYIFS